MNHEIYALAPKASYFGEGQFGLVKLCQNKANQSYAVKIVAGSLQSQATAELEILNYLKQLKGVADRTLPGFKRFKSKTVAHKSYIVQAKKPGKDMWSALYGNLPTIPYLNTTEKYMIAILACQEIQHLHEKNIIHSDIKPENFMLNKEGKMITIAAIDFGYAKQLTPTDQHYRVDNKNMPYYALKQIQGTTKYIAPEIANLEFYPDFSLKRFIDCQGHYYFASDIYSLGIMFIEDLEIFPIMKNDMLAQMLNHDPAQRPGLAQIMDYFRYRLENQTDKARYLELSTQHLTSTPIKCESI